jgi:hypothetical protein
MEATNVSSYNVAMHHVTCDNSDSSSRDEDDAQSSTSSNRVMYNWKSSASVKRGTSTYSISPSKNEECQCIEQSLKRPRHISLDHSFDQTELNYSIPKDVCNHSIISMMSSKVDKVLEFESENEEIDDYSDDSDDEREINEIMNGIEMLQECIESYKQEREHLKLEQRKQFEVHSFSNRSLQRCELYSSSSDSESVQVQSNIRSIPLASPGMISHNALDHAECFISFLSYENCEQNTIHELLSISGYSSECSSEDVC